MGWIFWELYLLGALFLMLVKMFRGNKPERLAGFPGQLSFDDYWHWLLPAMVFLGPILWPSSVLAIIGVALFALGFLVVWADAVLFRKMSIELDLVGIRTYLGDFREGFAEEWPALFQFFRRRLFTLLPLLAPLAYACLLFANQDWRYSLFLVILVGYTLWRIRHTYVTEKWGPFLLCLSLLCVHAWRVYAGHHDPAIWVLLALPLGILIAKCVVRARWVDGVFWQECSFLRHFWKPTYLQDDPRMTIREAHRALFQQSEKGTASANFGCLEGANIVLVTLESVGRYSLAPAHPEGAQAAFFKQLAKDAVISNHHFCMTPNTTSAFHAMYLGNYLNSAVEDRLAPLRARGYSTTFLSRGSKKPFGMGQLLEQVGFETVYGREDFKPHARDRGKLSDLALLDQGLAKLPCLEKDKPGFLHIHTMNTHSPYRVVEPKKFNRFGSATPWDRFRNSIEETDSILADFFQQLGTAGWLENTLVILVGDHGQAFGEFGYYYHSNAVIKEEIEVPFLMQHPLLEAKEISWSTHFDILPTIYDLLGIPLQRWHLGSSLLGQRPDPEFLLTAEPFRAGSPLNFGLIHGNRKYMIDLLFGHYLEMDWNDRVLAHLQGAERAYFQMLFYRMLRQHHLIGAGMKKTT